tara:strand:+ start:575 stop:814 length:240 start_codon:yes stop_codon:yes gene_type:complete
MKKPISELRAVGDMIGRKGMAEMAIKFVSECDGGYKSIMELCGKLSVIARMSTCDDYWKEQVCRGENKAEFIVEQREAT